MTTQYKRGQKVRLKVDLGDDLIKEGAVGTLVDFSPCWLRGKPCCHPFKLSFAGIVMWVNEEEIEAV